MQAVVVRTKWRLRKKRGDGARLGHTISLPTIAHSMSHGVPKCALIQVPISASAKTCASVSAGFCCSAAGSSTVSVPPPGSANIAVFYSGNFARQYNVDAFIDLIQISAHQPRYQRLAKPETGVDRTDMAILGSLIGGEQNA